MLFSINHRELLAVERVLSQLLRFLRGLVVKVYSIDTTAMASGAWLRAKNHINQSTTAMAYLRYQGDILSPTFELAQWILHWGMCA